MQRAIAARQAQVGGDWFFWVAGLSLANTLLAIMHTHFGFFFGLGVTGFAAYVAPGAGGWLAVTVVASAFFASFGLFARKGQQWAFIVGALFYLLDGLLLVGIHEYLEVAAHAYVLFRLFQGFQAARLLSTLPAYYPPSDSPPPTTPGVWPPPPSR